MPYALGRGVGQHAVLRVCYLSNGKSSVNIKPGQFRELDGMVELFDHALNLFWQLLQLREGMLRDLSVVPQLL